MGRAAVISVVAAALGASLASCGGKTSEQAGTPDPGAGGARGGTPGDGGSGPIFVSAGGALVIGPPPATGGAPEFCAGNVALEPIAPTAGDRLILMVDRSPYMLERAEGF